MDYEKKANILFSIIIVMGFYSLFELGIDPRDLSTINTDVLGQFRINFFYLMIGSLVISYLYFNLTTRQQKEMILANQRLKENEGALIKAKEEAESSAQAKMHFLSVMSHEIRTPLNAVIGLSDLIKNEELPDFVRENINLIHFSSNNLFSIVNDILDWSKIDSGKMELEKISLDLHLLLDSLAKSSKILCEQKGLQFKASLDDSVPQWIVGDSTRLTQILNNLLNNAIKFTQKGQVILSASTNKKRGNKVQLKFEVSDTGIGMDQEQVERVFDVFEQADSATARKFGGSGLGLSISRKLVRLMDSDIRIYSEPNKGSKFIFDLILPIAKSSTSAEDITSSEVLKGKSILIVDDNQINLVVAQNFLSRWGIEHSSALSAREALELMMQKDFDLILMDLSMPEMDGYEASQEIRRRGFTIPIIALTASALINDRGKVFASGMNDFESKPFKPNSLYSKLVKYLH
jgi:signal transduction histidine kinase/CheY-like chemotaxis protein